MVSLTQADLQLRIVDCAAGPASFDAELSAEGHRVISCDPLFSLSPDEIRSRIDAAYDTVVTNGRTAADEFVWREFTAPEHLGEARMAAMRRFLAEISRRGRRRHVPISFVLTAGQRHETRTFEQLINRLKQYRQVATRYEERGENHQAMLTIAAIMLWL
jgi:transposase